MSKKPPKEQIGKDIPKNLRKKNETKSEELPVPEKARNPNGSWTGKFPMALLHEHCQRSGWHKVRYDIVSRY